MHRRRWQVRAEGYRSGVDVNITRRNGRCCVLRPANNLATVGSVLKCLACPMLLVAVATCGEAKRPGIIEPPLSIELTTAVNVQLGDTPVGQEPSYIITGEAKATRGGVKVAASIDSIVVFWRLGQGAEWMRHLRRSSVPFSDRLPFTVHAGDTYQLRAVLHAHASYQDSVVSGSDEWIATGQAYDP